MSLENDVLQTDCYLLLLDASKAFDRLRDRNMCANVLRLLINMYINKKDSG